MSDSITGDGGSGLSRRKVLECMTWAGTGVLWTVTGGVPRSLGIIDQALAAEPSKLTFLQISDSHVGFDKPANPHRSLRNMGPWTSSPTRSATARRRPASRS